jgi:hypothetical protein
VELRLAHLVRECLAIVFWLVTPPVTFVAAWWWRRDKRRADWQDRGSA